MTTENPNHTVDFARLVQRQLLLLDHQDADENTRLLVWPRMLGVSARQSMRLFEILERSGWIVGFPAGDWGYSCTLTGPGNQILLRIRNGQPLMQGNDLEFNEEDYTILANAGRDTVFIVHGDDLNGANPFAVEVKRLIDAWGMSGQILDTRPGDVLLNAVMNQITNCGAAVCIWDADRENPETGNIRPNVLLETGVALGYLGHDRVFVIKRRESLVAPSDFGGVVWMNNNDWKDKLPTALYGVLRAPF